MLHVLSVDIREIDELVSFPKDNLTVIEGQSVRVLCSWASSQFSKYVQWSYDNRNIAIIYEDPYCKEEEGCDMDLRLTLNASVRTANRRSYMWQDKNCARREFVTHNELWIDAVRIEHMGRYTCAHFSTANNDERDENSIWIHVGKCVCGSPVCARASDILVLWIGMLVRTCVCLSVCIPVWYSL